MVHNTHGESVKTYVGWDSSSVAQLSLSSLTVRAHSLGDLIKGDMGFLARASRLCRLSKRFL